MIETQVSDIYRDRNTEEEEKENVAPYVYAAEAQQGGEGEEGPHDGGRRR